MPLRDWIERYPNVKRLMEQPDDVLEGVSVEPYTAPRHVYTLEHCAGETLRAGERVSFDGECVVRWLRGQPFLGVVLSAAEPGDMVQVQVSEAYFAH